MAEQGRLGLPALGAIDVISHRVAPEGRAADVGHRPGVRSFPVSERLDPIQPGPRREGDRPTVLLVEPLGPDATPGRDLHEDLDAVLPRV